MNTTSLTLTLTITMTQGGNSMKTTFLTQTLTMIHGRKSMKMTSLFLTQNFNMTQGAGNSMKKIYGDNLRTLTLTFSMTQDGNCMKKLYEDDLSDRDPDLYHDSGWELYEDDLPDPGHCPSQGLPCREHCQPGAFCSIVCYAMLECAITLSSLLKPITERFI